MHVPFGLIDGGSDSAEDAVAKDREHIESSEGDDTESSDSSDEDSGKKRAQSKTPKDKARIKRPHTVMPTSAFSPTPASALASSHYEVQVLLEPKAPPTIIMPIALPLIKPPAAIRIPSYSKENRFKQSLDHFCTQFEKEMK